MSPSRGSARRVRGISARPRELVLSTRGTAVTPERPGYPRPRGGRRAACRLRLGRSNVTLAVAGQQRLYERPRHRFGVGEVAGTEGIIGSAAQLLYGPIKVAARGNRTSAVTI